MVDRENAVIDVARDIAIGGDRQIAGTEIARVDSIAGTRDRALDGRRDRQVFGIANIGLFRFGVIILPSDVQRANTVKGLTSHLAIDRNSEVVLAEILCVDAICSAVDHALSASSDREIAA